MTDSLIEKLQHLDDLLQENRQHYDATYSELNSLKAKPSIDMEEFSQLKYQLSDTQEAYDKTTQENSELKQKFSQLENEHQTLIDAHSELNDKYKELAAMVESLETANKTLLEKNQLAREHTRVVYERLTKIDQA